MSQSSKNAKECTTECNANAKECNAKECSSNAKECTANTKDCNTKDCNAKECTTNAKECNANECKSDSKECTKAPHAKSSKECDKCTDLKSSTIAHGKQCAKECAKLAKLREQSRPDQATLKHAKECGVECANAAKERSSHSDEIRQTKLHGKECATECAHKALERAASMEELKQTQEHGKECAHECAEKAKQRAHSLGKDPVEISSEMLEKRKNLESVKDSISAIGRGPISNALCTLEDTFHRAVFWLTHSEALGDRTCDDKTFSYALWMQATHGDVCDCDRYLNQEEKSRWSAWNKLKGMNRAEAMSRYVAHCAKVDANWLKDQMLETFPTTEQVKTNVSNAFEVVKNSTTEAGGAVLNRASELADSLIGNENQQNQQNQQQQARAQQQQQNAKCDKNAKDSKLDAECASRECKESKECSQECKELKECTENRAKLNIKDERNKEREQATA